MEASKNIELLKEMSELILNNEWPCGDVGPFVRKRIPDSHHIELFRDTLHPLIHKMEQLMKAVMDGDTAKMIELRSFACDHSHMASVMMGNAQKRYTLADKHNLKHCLQGIFNEICYHKTVMEMWYKFVVMINEDLDILNA